MLRQDIQFLRGIAVLFVVIYHSGLGVLNEGYLGVDIFFVISGFLITKLILEKLAEDNFSFTDFYFRRAKRLLPALYSTLFFTTAIGVFFLTKSQWNDYLEQLLGALTFTANFVLPGQTGYFEQSSDGKPLLHIWSLSLEEQYYFVLPLFLFLIPRKLRLVGLLALFLVSAFWCFSWLTASMQDAPFLWRLNSATKYEWAFYLLPTRAWELLAGSICAWIFIYRPNFRVPKHICYLAMASIVFFGAVKVSSVHPGFPAIAVVISTSLLLLGDGAWLPRNVFSKWIQKSGDWSYSIYLVHWPLFSFAHLGYIGDVPQIISGLLIEVSVLLGYVQYKYVETPFRSITSKKTAMLPMLACTLMLAMPSLASISHPIYKRQSTENHFRINYGLDKTCSDSFTAKGIKAECTYGMNPNIVVWGDSYAMHLAEGLKQNYHFIQITKDMCGPIVGVAAIDRNYNRHFAENCIAYNAKALDYIVDNPNIKLVILSSPLSYYLSEKNDLLHEGSIKNEDRQVVLTSLRNTAKLLTKYNKKVVFVSPPPKNGKDIGQCLERLLGPTILLAENCSIQKADYLENQRDVLAIMDELEKIIEVKRLDSLLCDEQQCRVSANGLPLYRDGGHLSYFGSKYLLKEMSFDVKNEND